MTDAYSNKSRLGALLFCLFLGVLGAHRFYVGKHGTAILTILTFGGFGGLWPLVDLIMIIIGSFRDTRGRRVYYWSEPPSLPASPPAAP
jgi:TM2 domain-containing membrane protein YozV